MTTCQYEPLQNLASTQHSAANSREQDYEQFSNDYDVDDFSVDVKSTSSRFRGSKMGYSEGMSTSKVVLISILVAAVGIGLGVIIGWFSSQANFPEVTEAFKAWEAALEESDETEVRNMILEEMNAENIREFLRYMTRKPHLAGTPADKENADYVKDLWDQQGLDSATIVPYDVLLSYPDEEKPNFVNILDVNGSIFFQSQREEADLDGSPHEDTVFPFNAYAPAGLVDGELIYVNYARAEDFKKLEDELHINASGKIVLARYGKIYRGNKENEAWLRGAKGLIIYSDPADYAIEGSSEVYPNTWYLPESGVQRGSVFRPSGDPLTPAYPATENAFRESEDSIDLPHIPVQPISYGDAIHILREMEGDDVPDEWKGSLDVPYKLGPGLANGRKIQLDVNNKNVRRQTYNVIGMIRGSLEPDRYVLVGNHRDAWVFGAVDPSSGTAALLELTRVLGKLVKEGKWRPRRTIVFCSWGSEEHSLIGSTEWAEEFARTIGERAVAYINVDIAVQGNYTFRLKATPNLYDAVFDATKKVSDAPFPGHSSTVYDTWLERDLDDSTNKPYVSNVGSGSDYAVLLNRLGVSAVDLRYTYDYNLGLSSYPLYHSMYETFHLMNDIMDPSFEYHLALTRVWGELTRNLADSLILPLKGSEYGFKMRRSLDALKNEYQDQIEARGLSFDAIDAGLNFFTAAAQQLEAEINLKAYEDDPFAVRKMNDKLMLMERAFIDPLGLPGQPLVRHVIFAPSSKDSYFGDAFPGITDLLYDINNGQDNDAKWSELEKHMSVVAFTLQSAAATLISEGQLVTRS